jgi:hypothetical protein
MNTNCPPAALTAAAAATKPPEARGPFAILERIINSGGFVSVDLTDAIFASLPRRDGAPYEAVLRTNCSE